MCIAVFQVDAQPAPRDAGEIEQIVNQTCLQLHVAFDQLHILHELLGNFFSVLLQVSRCRKRRRKRSAQFMAQCRKKIILGLARFLRCNFLSLELPATDLVGDVARDFGIAPKRSLVVAQRSEYDFGFKSRSILADAEPLITNVPATSCFAQITLGLASSDVFCGIETGKVLTYNFSRHVAFDLLGSLVPRHDSAVRIEHVNGVFFDAIHKNVELFGCLMQD